MTMILPMHHADLDEVAKLLSNLPHDLSGRERVSPRALRGILEASFEDASYSSFVARQADGAAVGYIGINDRYGIYAGGRYCQITELYVADDQRRTGVGRRLVTAAEHHAKSRNALAIELGAIDSDSGPDARAFYLSLGYDHAARRLRKALR